MTGNKWALLIGVSRYQHAATPTLRDLNGPMSDVADMRKMLQSTFSFEPANIVTLTDEDATRASIIEAIKAHLISNARAHDAVVIYFSGHGSYKVRDRAREGTLIAHDSRGPGGSDLDGSTLSDLLQEIATKNVTLLLDSCHSGNLIESRGPASGRIIARTAPPDTRESGSGLAHAADAFRGSITMRTERAPFALLSAAGPHELAFERELEGKCRGVFTYCLTRELQRMGATVTYRDVMDRVCTLVSGWFVGQTPQLEGTLRDRFVFTEEKCIMPPYILAEPVRPGWIRLDAGRTAGVTPSSLYAVYAPGAKMLSGGEPVATIEVVEATASSSLARRVSGEEVLPASRAVEINHCPDRHRVMVRLSGIPLAERFRRYRHLELLPEQDDGTRKADITLIERNGFLETHVAGLGAQLPPLPPVRFSLSDAERLVLHWAKWLNILRIQNADAKLDVNFRIEPIPAEPAGHAIGPAPVFYDDGRIHYTIENKSGCNLFVGLLALADDGSTSMVFPKGCGSKLLLDGGKFEDTLRVDRLEGRECEFNVLKLFAAVQRCDYGLLELQSLNLEISRRGSGPLNALEELLAEAAFGRARKIHVSATFDKWITKQQHVPIYRRG